MAAHAFPIFQDRSPRSQYRVILPDTGLTKRATSFNGSQDDLDKENINPRTGEHTEPMKNKKRKSSGLSTKSHAHAPLTMKGQVESSQAKPVSIKPKTSTRTKSTKKNPRSSRKGRKIPTVPSSRGSPLSQIDEERASELEIERIQLADVESRCYELTVKPLVDLSEAFGCPQAFIPQGRAPGDDDEMSADKDYVFDLDLDPCDYLTPVPPTPPTTPTKTSPKHTTSFSTPERKLLFAAFSFSSPSPSSDRKAKSVSSGSASLSPSP